ncbi:Transcription factor Ash2 [Aphelenchoides besseyi]|nr:Transcription factor Ash2 [Aphelenchoides besseyi]KAI6211555.1 Transcription factor Ash2 [Aphelenchoides besseyi]
MSATSSQNEIPSIVLTSSLPNGEFGFQPYGLNASHQQIGSILFQPAGGVEKPTPIHVNQNFAVLQTEMPVSSADFSTVVGFQPVTTNETAFNSNPIDQTNVLQEFLPQVFVPTTQSKTENQPKKKFISPFSPEATVPLPSQLDELGNMGTTVWRRNERERYRVRCVNEGYAQLRNHLPLTQYEKRLSKVDTLRLAILYIRHLELLIQNINHESNCGCFLNFTPS